MDPWVLALAIVTLGLGLTALALQLVKKALGMSPYAELRRLIQERQEIVDQALTKAEEVDEEMERHRR
jgi:hypothetical protein